MGRAELTDCQQQRQKQSGHETSQDLRPYPPRLDPRETEKEVLRRRSALSPVPIPMSSVSPTPPRSALLSRAFTPRTPRPTSPVPSPLPTILCKRSELSLLRIREKSPMAILSPRSLHVLRRHGGNRLRHSGHNGEPRSRGGERSARPIGALRGCGARRRPVGPLRPGPSQVR